MLFVFGVKSSHTLGTVETNICFELDFQDRKFHVTLDNTSERHKGKEDWTAQVWKSISARMHLLGLPLDKA